MDQFATGAATQDLEAIAARVAPYGWHIEINIAKSADWVELEPRLKRCPVPLVFDHLGRVRGGEGVNSAGFKVILRMLSVREDCWVKLSSWYRLSDAGMPTGVHSCADLVDQLESWIPDDAMREPLFASNAAKLYRL